MYEHLNDIYITDRLAARLAEIESHAVATVVAPMGYGKTTAIRHWQAQTAQAHPEAVILRQSIFSDSVGDLWRGFCRLLARHDTPLAKRMREAGFPQDLQGCGLMADLWEETRPPDSPSGGSWTTSTCWTRRPWPRWPRSCPRAPRGSI